MPIYSLIEYSDNYSDTSWSVWGFKRDDVVDNADVTNNNNAPSFKYKASVIGDTENNGTYLSNFGDYYKCYWLIVKLNFH